jgi:hypothetical protein
MASRSSYNNSIFGPWSFAEYSDFFTYYSPFFRPKLRIEHNSDREQNTYAPQFSPGGYTQRCMKIRVHNTGHRMLHNCQAELRVIIPNGALPDEIMRYPSDDSKLLVWGRLNNLTDLVENQNIQGHSSQLVHVVFSDSEFANTPVANGTPTRYACVSTVERLSPRLRPAHLAINLRVEDSFTNGEFLVDLIITSDEGPYKRCRLLIQVDQNWENLTMLIYSRRFRLRRIISRFYNRLKRLRLLNKILNH